MDAEQLRITANVVDVLNRRVFPATVEVSDGKIVSVDEGTQPQSTFLLPGFVDAHVHIESSMLVPAEFARAAVVHGTVAAVSDPHEIGNVLGVDGVRFMLDNAEAVPFKFCFGAPSCVPATPFETAGECISVEQVESLLDDDRIGYLSEMMNVPGVLAGDAEVTAKIRAARDRGKPIDGHAPGLRGPDAKAYFAAGISTDHECFTEEEAREKLGYGAKIMIREGSAARNFDALCTLISDHAENCMFSSDDKHPDELLAGHVNVLVKRAVAGGTDLMSVLHCACVTPVRHYGLDVGLLQPGDEADFIEVDDLENFRVLRTFIRGELVAENGRPCIPQSRSQAVNRFAARPVTVEEFQVEAILNRQRRALEKKGSGPICAKHPSGRPGKLDLSEKKGIGPICAKHSSGRPGKLDLSPFSKRMNVIEAIDGELITGRHTVEPKVEDGRAVSDPQRDLLKIAVINRYQPAAPAVAFIRGFGLKRGAMASSVAHDSHNIIAVGCSDEELCAAVDMVVREQGGLSIVADGISEVLPLPVAGLMSTAPASEVGPAYASLDRLAKQLGSTLQAPFMTLSFMALLVIPEIKLSDRGLFDGNRFEFLPLFE